MTFRRKLLSGQGIKKQVLTNKTAIFICGPTAAGKTGVAIQLASWLQTEIISFDSRQFFRELKIGAAPPSVRELGMVKHHLIGQLSVEDDYNAGDFEKEALQIVDRIFKNHEAAVLVGGSGMYMQALTEGFDDMPEGNPHIRVSLREELESQGLEKLLKELYEKDPNFYHIVDRQNPQRVMRALEVIRSTGQPYSSFRKGEKAKRPFNILKIGITLPREELYAHINRRVDKMVEAGLEEEVKSLLPFREKNALKTVGYREFVRYFDGEWDRETAIAEIKKNSRRYAKRQLTWFRRDDEIKWFGPKEIEAIREYVLKHTRPAL